MSSEGNEMAIANQISGLSTKITDGMLAEMKEQRKQLEKFVVEQLRDGTDYGVIPGVKEKSLFKPGAEKMASIFQLGSRIVKTDRTVDIKENFAMYEVTVEIFHVPSGKAIAQCTGVTNSQEKKWRERQEYEWVGQYPNKVKKPKGAPVPTPIGDILNTMCKIAQKRAFVGGVVMATKASDFLTHDLAEDEEDFNEKNPNYHQELDATREEELRKIQERKVHAAPISKAMQGDVVDTEEKPPQKDERGLLNDAIKIERSRLGWEPADVSKFILENFGKEGKLLTNPEMKLLVDALKRQEKR